MIRIDDTRCIRCGLCARVCAPHCLQVTSEHVTVSHETNCMHCGQCMAVCPKAAIRLDDINPDTLPPVSALPDAEQLTALIRNRRSTRVFTDDAVSRDILLRALDVVRYAPTGKNLENVTWLVLEGKAALRRVADCVVEAFRGEKRLEGVVQAHDLGGDPIFRGAPCAVFACAEGSYDLDIVNCSIAVTSLDLLLPTLGLGGCWAGYVMRAAALNAGVRNAMGTVDGLLPMAGLMVGYPAIGYRRIPPRRELRVRWVNGEQA